MSFELELLRIDEDDKILIIERVDCRYGLALAKVLAEDLLQQRCQNGASVDAVRVVDIDGAEVFRCTAADSQARP